MLDDRYARQINLPEIGIEGQKKLSNSSIVVIGAGFIACEFACILNGLGVEVVQLVRGDSLLRGFDKELAWELQESMKKENY